MQIGSSTNSTSRAKAAAKTKRAKSDAPAETLHLKAKKPAKASAKLPAGDLASMIATAAYYRAAQRGFEPGHELEDWLEAEHQVRSHLSS